jgi:hypothetical protein
MSYNCDKHFLPHIKKAINPTMVEKMVKLIAFLIQDIGNVLTAPFFKKPYHRVRFL